MNLFVFISLAVILTALVMATAFLVRSYMERKEAEKARASAWSKYKPFRDEHQSLEKTRMFTLKELGLAGLMLLMLGICPRVSAQAVPPPAVRLGEPMTQELAGTEDAPGVRCFASPIKAGPPQGAPPLRAFTPDPSLFRFSVDPSFYSRYDVTYVH